MEVIVITRLRVNRQGTYVSPRESDLAIFLVGVNADLVCTYNNVGRGFFVHERTQSRLLKRSTHRGRCRLVLVNVGLTRRSCGSEELLVELVFKDGCALSRRRTSDYWLLLRKYGKGSRGLFYKYDIIICKID